MNSGLSKNNHTIQLIKDAVDVELLMLNLGFKIFRKTYDELRAPCALHGGDNPTAFSMRLSSKRWKCFTRRCELSLGDRPDNDIIALVQKAKRVSFVQALQYLAEFSGISLTEAGEVDPARVAKFKRERDIQKFVGTINRLSSRESPLPAISEEAVAGYRDNKDTFFEDQGFATETLDLFEVGAKTDERGVRRATIPIRDHLGNLVSISGRREDGDTEPRYKLEKNFEKSKVIYNLNLALQTGCNTIIIIEGFKACWAVVEAGYFNCGAVMGSVVTYPQQMLLAKCGFTNCLLMLDGDESGRKGAKQSAPQLRKFFNTRVIDLPDGICPDDLDRRELSSILESNLKLF
jgi:DNA primase